MNLSRRALLGGLAGVSLGGLVAGCGDPGEGAVGTADASAPAGPWTFTDDLGQRVELDSMPTRVAGYGDAAAALWNFGVPPVAVFHYVPPEGDDIFAGKDLGDVAVVGSTYGELSLEKLAAAAPDLIVTTTYSEDTKALLYGFKDETQLAKVRRIAPVVAVKQIGSAVDVIKANERLAAALGVDPRSGQVAEDRAAFEKASIELRAAARSDLSVVAVYAEAAGGLWYAKAPDDPALNYYRHLGVDFVAVGGKKYYWHQVSWENADLYDADVVLYSLRDSLTPAQLMRQPTFARLAAARADQLHPWRYMSMDYPNQTAYLRELAGWLSKDRKVT